MANRQATGLFGLEPEAFVWATGIEDTFTPQTDRVGERALDEYALAGHDRDWRECHAAERVLRSVFQVLGAPIAASRLLGDVAHGAQAI